MDAGDNFYYERARYTLKKLENMMGFINHKLAKLKELDKNMTRLQYKIAREKAKFKKREGRRRKQDK